MSDYKLILDANDKAGQFTAVTTIPRWAFLKMSAAAKKSDETQMAALYDLTLALIQKDEHEAFDEYMSQNDEAFEGLQTAISDLCELLVNRPLDQPSPSSQPLNSTEQSSRVVSFSQATATPVVAEPLENVPTDETNSSTL